MPKKHRLEQMAHIVFCVALMLLIFCSGKIARADYAVAGVDNLNPRKPLHVAVSQTTGSPLFFYTVPDSGELLMYNPMTLTKTPISLNGGSSTPWDLAIYENGANSQVYVTDSDNFRVFVYDMNSASVLGPENVNLGPHGIAVHSTLGKVYITCSDSDSVWVMNTADQSQAALLSGNGLDKPWDVAVNETTNMVYVTSYNTGELFAYDATTDSYVKKYSVGSGPNRVEVNEEDNKVYITRDMTTYMTVVDVDEDTGSSINVSAVPYDVAYNPAIDFYYVTFTSQDGVKVFDSYNDEAVSTEIDLVAGSGPKGIAVYETGIGAGGIEPWVTVTADYSTGTTTVIQTTDTYAPHFAGLKSAQDAANAVTPTVYLQWDAAVDASSNITYNVYTSTTPNDTGFDFGTPSYSTTSTGLIYYTSGLNYGDKLYYIVRASDSALTGPFEDTNKNAYTTTVTDGAAPTGVGITSVSNTQLGGEVQLNWAAAADAHPPITYNIYLALQSGSYNWSTPYATTAATTYTLSGLTNNVVYYFQLGAEDVGGLESTGTIEFSTMATDLTAPTFAGITNAADTTQGSSVNIAWAAATDNSTPITYYIYYNEGAAITSYATPQTSVTSGINTTITGLTNTQQYTFAVRAQDSQGNMNTVVAELQATPTDIVDPTFAGASSCSDRGNSSDIRVSWMLGSDNSTPITYNIYMATQSGVVNYNFASASYQTVSSSIFDVSGLTVGNPYYFIVRAKDAAGREENNTVEVGPCVPTDGTKPTFSGIQSAAATGVSGQVMLGWNAATDDSPPIYYNIYSATSSAGQNFASWSIQTTATSSTINGLTDGQTYYYVVRAEDSGGLETTTTAEKSVMPNDGAAPVFSGISSATDTGVYDEIYIEWSAATDSNPPITYTVFLAQATNSQNFSGTPDYTTTATGMQIDGLVNNQKYFVAVRAKDAGGVSSTNTQEVAVTPTDKTAPAFGGVSTAADTGDGGEIEVRWTNVTDPSAPVTYQVFTSIGAATPIDYSTPTYYTNTSPFYATNLQELHYNFAVWAKDAAGNIAKTYGTQGDTPSDTTPPTFSGISSAVTGSNSGEINLAWSAATDFSTPVTYLIYYGNSNNVTSILSGGIRATTTASTATISGLTNNIRYYFLVRAQDAKSNVNNTTVKYLGATPLDLNAPTFAGLSSVVDTTKGGQVTLSWSAATDTSTPIYYKIYYSKIQEQCTSSYKFPTSSVSVNVDDLDDGATYYFAVGAVDSRGNETKDADYIVVSGMSTDQTAPTFDPSSIEATNTKLGGEIMLSWDTATDNTSPVQYNIYQSTTSNSFDYSTPTYTVNSATSYTATGLVNATPYYFKVTAEDSSTYQNETSTAAAQVSATPSDETAPTFAGIKSVVDYSENGEAKISWNAATDKTPPISYEIFKASISGGYNGFASATYVTASTTYIVSNLRHQGTYFFTVLAKDSAPTPNRNSSSVEYEYTFTDTIGPAKSTAFTAAAGDATDAVGGEFVTLSWASPTTNTDGSTLVDMIGYNIYRGTFSGQYDTIINQVKDGDYVSATRTSYIDDEATGLTAGTTYYYVIVALDDAGNLGETSAQVSVTPLNSDAAIPNPPQNVQISAASGSVTVTWEKPIYNSDDTLLKDLQGYLIYRKSDVIGDVFGLRSGSYDSPISPDTLTFVDTNVTNGTTYYYYLISIDSNTPPLESEQSSIVSAKPESMPDYPPSAPTNLAINEGDYTAYLSWAKPTTNSDGSAIGTDLASYNIYRANGATATFTKINTATQTTTSYTDSGLSSAIEYQYYVTALDGAGQESASSTVATVVFGSLGVTGTVSLRDINNQTDTGYSITGASGMTVHLVDTNGTILASATTDSEGDFKIVYESAQSSDTYQVWLEVEDDSGFPYKGTFESGNGYLVLDDSVTITDTFATLSPTPSPIAVGPAIGDINCDNAINLFDIATMKTAIGSSEGDDEYNINADVNGDGAVNLFDIATMKAYFSLQTMPISPSPCQ